ncbi:uncharacterized protein BT62DRAFT_999608 [Guyanagaster necrorhizus]|uniref:Uncharacterized protein n=1 Tax=Guyanagaster necrorhizus TaxID=856835 RepID=A0A9P7W4M3_9AGAR|nr:uncharacterized protein BT62DRAFT_999608 [Guyanagaster necrorhizus MCA 3950]KAG7451875.1 hypothetical protein BT62DRAFT_999608 [Guyanagaster necrorhizus MCA 3950]
MKAMFQGKKNPVKTRPYDLRAEVPAKVGIAECVIDVIASVEGFIHGHFQKEGGREYPRLPEQFPASEQPREDTVSWERHISKVDYDGLGMFRAFNFRGVQPNTFNEGTISYDSGEGVSGNIRMLWGLLDGFGRRLIPKAGEPVRLNEPSPGG